MPNPRTPNERPEKDARAEAYRRAAIERAVRLWREPPSDDGARMRAYVAARGIAGLDGAVAAGAVRPGFWKYIERCPAGTGGRNSPVGPALVAAIVGTRDDGTIGVHGVHRTFLDPSGAPKKRRDDSQDDPPPGGGGFGGPKQMLGKSAGGAAWLGPRDKGVFPGRAIVLAEGIETALACSTCTGLVGVAALSAEFIARWQPPARMFVPAGPVGTVIVAADTNPPTLTTTRMRERWFEGVRRHWPEACAWFEREDRRDELVRLVESGVGERWAMVFAARMRSVLPHVRVFVRPAVGVEPAGVAGGAGGAGKSGLDWLDVLNAKGAGAVAAGLLGEETLDTLSLYAEAKTADLVSAGWVPEPVGHAAGEAGGRTSARPPADSFGGEGGAGGGDVAGWSGGRGGNGGDAGGVDSGGGGPRPWDGPPLGSRPILTGGPLEHARRWLCEEACVPGADRFGLLYWGSKWWSYDGRAYVEVSDDHLDGRLQAWLAEFRLVKWSEKDGKREPISKPFIATPEAAAAVRKSLIGECGVSTVEIPAFLPGQMGGDGAPVWGARKGWGVALPRTESRGAASARIVFANGLVDMAKLARLRAGQVPSVEPHDPTLFSTTCLPFAFDSESFSALLGMLDGARADSGDGAAWLPHECPVMERLAPRFWRWMWDASDGDAAWMWQLVMMLGDTISGDRSIEKIFAVVGLKRGGKGIIEDSIAAILGESNIAGLDSMSLTDRFGLAPLVGKAAVIMPDAQFDAQLGPFVVERLKSIRGRGRMAIRDLYDPAVTLKLGCRIWIFSNSQPQAKDESGALGDSFIWLPITKSYINREDPKIKDSIPREAPGIMLLAMLGAVELARMERRHIPMCDVGQGMAEEMISASAPLQAYVEECLGRSDDENAEAWPTIEDCYMLYVWWCVNRRLREPLGMEKFRANIGLATDAKEYYRPSAKGDAKRRRRLKGFVIADRVRSEAYAWIRANHQQRELSSAWGYQPPAPELY